MAQMTETRAYDSDADARSVVSALEQSGVPHSDINLIGRGTNTADGAHDGDAQAEHAEKGAGTGASLGTVVGGGLGLLAGIGTLAIPGVGPVVAAGWLIATLTGAGIGAAVGGGAGGLVGLLTGTGVSDEDANVYAESVRRGGSLVTVRAEDTMMPKVREVLDRYATVDPAARRAEYERAGWTAHDPEAEPYVAGTEPTRRPVV